jgi:hypothetical protein
MVLPHLLSPLTFAQIFLKLYSYEQENKKIKFNGADCHQ